MRPRPQVVVLPNELTADMRRLGAIVSAQQAILDVDSEESLDAALEAIAEICREATGGEGAVVEMLEGAELWYRAAVGLAAARKGLRLPLAGSLSGASLAQGQLLRCD